MKGSSLRGKFKNNFVKPLYRKVKNKSVKPVDLTSVDVNRTFNLCGTEISVRKKVISDTIKPNVVVVVQKHISDNKNSLPGSCVDVNLRTGHVKQTHGIVNSLLRGDTNNSKSFTMSDNEHLNFDRFSKASSGNNNKFIQAENDLHKIPGYWLRVYPLPKLPEESLYSVLLRCLICQLGLTSILILWTIIWTFVIQTFEGPYETKISLDFENEQNQLVIDLATELRQITPISPKWKAAIVQRIEDERQLTMVAMARGAKLHPGQFWDLSGTFLFTVYVMTALGFGAPVPQTPWGRTSALIYAVLAVPTHIYLMLNMSTYVIVHTELIFVKCRKKLCHDTVHKNKLNNKDSHDCSRPPEVSQPLTKFKCNMKIQNLLSVFCACRCLPLTIVTYYVCGVVAFGVLREKEPLETAMFPLEFTTTGGLEHVNGYVRILYGFYVEGAMTLLALTLATMRRHSSGTIGFLADKYRLFQIENDRD